MPEKFILVPRQNMMYLLYLESTIYKGVSMIKQYMSAMGVDESQYQSGDFAVHSPIDGEVIGTVDLHQVSDE